MRKGILYCVLAASLLSMPCISFAWGKKGHELVAEIAFHFLDDSTKKVIKDYLGNMSIEEAANWMDDARGNSYYDFQRTWHYLDMDKGETYKPSSERNILTVLHSAILELRGYKTMKKKDVKRALLLIFHLVGDLHQPLHTGYAIDKGGNTVDVTSPVVSGNLHSVWDTQIIEYKGIGIDSCLAMYDTFTEAEKAEMNKVNELKWMNHSRSLLDTVYSFQNNFLDLNYINSNSVVIKKQLLLGGAHLAAIMKDVFTTPKKPVAT
ncbi:MAG: S1/P1 nuclease [Ferruginibacter sp.]